MEFNKYDLQNIEKYPQNMPYLCLKKEGGMLIPKIDLLRNGTQSIVFHQRLSDPLSERFLNGGLC